MQKSVLWIDDNSDVLAEGAAILRQVGGITPILASSSQDAKNVLATTQVDAIVTDILRRNPDRSIALDDGYRFFREHVRPTFPALPVIFHTKNLPSTFQIDDRSEYLSKWDSPAKKLNELEARLADKLLLYDAHADLSTWNRIEPRLVQLNSALLDRLRSVGDVWSLTPEQFEQLAGELLLKNGYSVLWVPGGKDGGIDIVASSGNREYLIDVKRYKAARPVTVELVRAIYGVAEATASSRPGRIVHGGIITSSRFTSSAEDFKRTLRLRPLLHGADWLRTQLVQFAPRLRA
jgi:CheY-like chemotaxis protein